MKSVSALSTAFLVFMNSKRVRITLPMLLGFLILTSVISGCAPPPPHHPSGPALAPAPEPLPPHGPEPVRPPPP